MKTTIERLGHLGDGIAAGPIFVALTLPGEVVEGELEGDRIVAAKILAPSTDRVRAPCSHFKICGGCNLQHASDGFIENWKAETVHVALTAHGVNAPEASVTTSPPMSRRRATLSVKRTKKGTLVGFHARASDTIVEIPNCQLLQAELLAAVPLLREVATLGGSRKAELSCRVTCSRNGIDLAVSGGKPLDEKLRMLLPGLVEKYRAARLTWDGELVAQRELPWQNFDGIQVLPPPDAFLQATNVGQGSLMSAVSRAVGQAGRVVDLFSGCGTFSLPLAARSEVHAVESDKDMLLALDAGWRSASGLKKISTEARDLFRRPLMPDELKKFDAVVVDPPRAGAEAQARELAKSTVGKIAAVSCNPVTFARDAKILCDAGFKIDTLDVIDQFRWSPHVELVAQFSR